jgi:hypothetical protein
MLVYYKADISIISSNEQQHFMGLLAVSWDCWLFHGIVGCLFFIYTTIVGLYLKDFIIFINRSPIKVLKRPETNSGLPAGIPQTFQQLASAFLQASASK